MRGFDPQRGDIWLVNPPEQGGREQSGVRPAIVLQDASYAGNLPLVLVVPLTSQPGSLRFPATVQIAPFTRNGLSVNSFALVFQVRVIDRARFIKRLGSIEEPMLESIFLELDRLTGRVRAPEANGN